jgi:hypothetical protein
MLIYKLLRLLLLIYLIGGTIQCSRAQDSGKICLTYPEFRHYAKALIERNHLQVDTGALRIKERALSGAIQAHTDEAHADSIVIAQKGKIIVVQQDLLTTSANNLSAEKKKKVFWRTSAFILIGASVILLVR